MGKIQERQMANGLISYLNAVIKAATIKAGVQYIDIEHAFDGHRLCDAGAKAVNGFSIGDSAGLGLSDQATRANGSFHPNAFGHQLMSQALIQQSANFIKPMPQANLLATAPYDNSTEYQDFLNSAPTGGYDVSTRFIYEAKQQGQFVTKTTALHLLGPAALLVPDGTYDVIFHSVPINAGTVHADSSGQLDTTISVPADLPPGYHTVHLLGKDIAGEDVDIQQVVYVAASADDINGDNIPDTQQACHGLIPDSGIDQDHDGIDDACDPEITQAPADTTPPTVTGTPDRTPDANSWYNHDVHITWTAADPAPSSSSPSQPTPTQPSQPPTTLATQEGNQTYTSDPSCDLANNCAAGSLTIPLDKTSPTITYQLSPTPNTKGWSSSAATVTFSCQDTLSGIASCSQPVTVTNDGTYVVTGTSTDVAGNTSTINAIVSVDRTKPTITNTVSTLPNAGGWYNSPVHVAPQCSDATSGIASCTGAQDVATEGTSQAVTTTATDNAGNTTSTVSHIRIDTTAPAITSLEWSSSTKPTTQSSTLTAHTSDNLSGVRRVEYFLGDPDPGVGNATALQPTGTGTDYITVFGPSTPTGVYKVTVRAQDTAGNWSDATTDYLVVYDTQNVRATGRRTVVPSLARGDVLPGLIASDQTDTLKFAFNVGYDKRGRTLQGSGLALSYTTGARCTKPTKAVNCHSTVLVANTINWVTTQGANNSTAIFQGLALLLVDGRLQLVQFRLTATDGSRVSGTAPDHVTVQIFKLTDGVNTAVPMYKVNEDVVRGNVTIKP